MSDLIPSIQDNSGSGLVRRPPDEVRFILFGPTEKWMTRVDLTGDLEHDRLVTAARLREFLGHVMDGNVDGALTVREEGPLDGLA